MCGIAGVLDTNGLPVSPSELRRMSDSLSHRGPDGEGQYIEGPVGVAHRRLSIIDLSDAAREPMTGEDKNAVLVFNGEIYNFQDLRSELELQGHIFTSRTDAEVVVHGYESWGAAVVERLNGMFAFALYDRQQQRLLLARDRFGIKPLYWAFDRSRLIFASEIKAILAQGDVRPAVSPEALDQYFTFQNVLTDITLFEGVRLLPPGTTLTIAAQPGATPLIQTWWDYPFEREKLQITVPEAAEEIHRLFVRAVVRQTVSDVEVGAYLSGGMDSSSITAVAGRHLPRLRTFTAGFDLGSASGLELGFDERRAAEALAAALKTEHYEVVLHAGDMEEVLPRLVWHLEDLRVGQSYPNYYIAGLASRFVKVVLSGAGGDELFGGYPWRYQFGMSAASSEDFFGSYYGFWQRLARDGEKKRLFRSSVQQQLDGGTETFDIFKGVFKHYSRPLRTPDDFVDASLYFELKTFLHGLLLVEDKLSMAHSLETRVPFLDNDLVDFAVQLPASVKVGALDSKVALDENVVAGPNVHERRAAEGKLALRAAMTRVIPDVVRDRAKQGFSAPDGSWFRGDSIQYIYRLLTAPKARLYDYLEPAFVKGVLDDHASGRQNRRLLIWSFLCFEWWCRSFLDGSGGDTTDLAVLVRQS